MIRVDSYIDSRLTGFCIYCGGSSETEDHVPPKALLDKPHPENLMVVESCGPCNNGASLDEEYFACLIECILIGSTEAEKIKRGNIQRSLSRNEKLRNRIELARCEKDGQIYFQPEMERVKRVLLKMARAHANFEHGLSTWDEPLHFSIQVLPVMMEEEKAVFFADRSDLRISGWPEVGSRGLERATFALQDARTSYPWVTVQEGNYSFAVSLDSWNPRVRLLIRDYLAVEIGWE